MVLTGVLLPLTLLVACGPSSPMPSGPSRIPEPEGSAPAVEYTRVAATILSGGTELSNKDALPAGAIVEVKGVPEGSIVSLVGEVDGKTTTAGGFSAVGEPGSWATAELPPEGEWQLSVSGLRVHEKTIRFRTEAPATVDTPYVYPSSGTYGIGMPITVTFDGPVDNKAEVQERLRVRASQPIGAAAWSWTSPSTVTFLPDKFWPAYTDVEVTVDLDGVEISDGVWSKTVSAEFSIGRALVMQNDLEAHTLDVYEDGELVRQLPMSGGKPGYETLSGVKVISELFEEKRLQNLTGPETWDVTVPWAMRLTYSGEFIHSAPWNGDIGAANTSHGCTNLTTSDAQWLFERVRIGDVVEAYGSGVPVPTWDGLGGIWNQSWASWKSGGAEPQPVDTAPAPVPTSPMDFPG